jgi:hypothetical protein
LINAQKIIILKRYREIHVKTAKICFLGVRVFGLFRHCNNDFYLDLKDGKYKPYKDDNNFKNCEIVKNNLYVSCEFQNYLRRRWKICQHKKLF